MRRRKGDFESPGAPVRPLSVSPSLINASPSKRLGQRENPNSGEAPRCQARASARGGVSSDTPHQEPVRVMDLDAFRAPGGRMQGASTKAMPCASSRMTQRRRWPSAAETLRAAAGCVASLRCRGLDVSLWIRLRPCALSRSQAACGAPEPITRTDS